MRDFNHTVNVLVKAYINDTLQHGSCSACAVGNIISANGYELDRRSLLYMSWYEELTGVYFLGNPTEAEKQISVTGYSRLELAKIEMAFEKQNKEEETEDRMFYGLMRVVDVLAEIHNIDLKQKDEAKALFVKA